MSSPYAYTTPEDVRAMNEGWAEYVGSAAIHIASRVVSAISYAALTLELSLSRPTELPSSYEDWPVTDFEPTIPREYEGRRDA